MTEEIKLNSSKLGTKEYWDNFYKKEQQNFKNNNDDTGECWFDDSDAESKIIQFLINELIPYFIENSTISFLDLGTGNGHLLFQLSEDLQEVIELEGAFHENEFVFHGIDYSSDSVLFAQDIASKKYSNNNFKFDQVDLLSSNSEFLNNNKFDIILDKGTLDAIALNQDIITEDGKRGMDIYATQVKKMMKFDSILLITSCNFTEKELIKVITSQTNLEVYDKINYPSFQFGGVKGSTVVSIAFCRAES
ncbi:EFM4 [Candida pseudojiufengensis]|uniref:EFM4 n=1 Tax=Candida pseudojiufengensis TaxID=497109 RepID=UPI002225578D|nr:EFM4 [Candida pseudojiufengensis]KAI5966211.1 EFM4 [Candida pseudojiufengensis]